MDERVRLHGLIERQITWNIDSRESRRNEKSSKTKPGHWRVTHMLMLKNEGTENPRVWQSGCTILWDKIRQYMDS